MNLTSAKGTVEKKLGEAEAKVGAHVNSSKMVEDGAKHTANGAANETGGAIKEAALKVKNKIEEATS